MVMESPEVKKAVKAKLEKKIKKDMEDPKIRAGWDWVKKGGNCIYPGCKKKAEYANYHGLPLCREHHDLSQWIGVVLYEIEEAKLKEKETNEQTTHRKG